MANWQRASKQEAKYTDEGSKTEYCGRCEHYIVPFNCTKVNGKIYARGWCRFFEVIKQRYSMGRGQPSRQIRG